MAFNNIEKLKSMINARKVEVWNSVENRDYATGYVSAMFTVEGMIAVITEEEEGVY